MNQTTDLRRRREQNSKRATRQIFASLVKAEWELDHRAFTKIFYLIAFYKFLEKHMHHAIDTKLQDLACPVSSFILICAGLISRPTLTKVLQGEKNLDRNLEDKLVALLGEMAELKCTSPVAPDWSDAVGIQKQLAVRRATRQAIEYDQTHFRELLLNANAS